MLAIQRMNESIKEQNNIQSAKNPLMLFEITVDAINKISIIIVKKYITKFDLSLKKPLNLHRYKRAEIAIVSLVNYKKAYEL